MSRPSRKHYYHVGGFAFLIEVWEPKVYFPGTEKERAIKGRIKATMYSVPRTYLEFFPDIIGLITSSVNCTPPDKFEVKYGQLKAINFCFTKLDLKIEKYLKRVKYTLENEFYQAQLSLDSRMAKVVHDLNIKDTPF
jgi:hypothetical protein